MTIQCIHDHSDLGKNAAKQCHDVIPNVMIYVCICKLANFKECKNLLSYIGIGIAHKYTQQLLLLIRVKLNKHIAKMMRNKCSVCIIRIGQEIYKQYKHITCSHPVELFRCMYMQGAIIQGQIAQIGEYNVQKQFSG